MKLLSKCLVVINLVCILAVVGCTSESKENQKETSISSENKVDEEDEINDADIEINDNKEEVESESKKYTKGELITNIDLLGYNITLPEGTKYVEKNPDQDIWYFEYKDVKTEVDMVRADMSLLFTPEELKKTIIDMYEEDETMCNIKSEIIDDNSNKYVHITYSTVESDYYCVEQRMVLVDDLIVTISNIYESENSINDGEEIAECILENLKPTFIPNPEEVEYEIFEGTTVTIPPNYTRIYNDRNLVVSKKGMGNIILYVTDVSEEYNNIEDIAKHSSQMFNNDELGLYGEIKKDETLTMPCGEVYICEYISNELKNPEGVYTMIYEDKIIKVHFEGEINSNPYEESYMESVRDEVNKILGSLSTK